VATFYNVDIHQIEVEIDDDEIIDYISDDIGGTLDQIARRQHGVATEVIDWLKDRHIERLREAVKVEVEPPGITIEEYTTIEQAAHILDCLAIAADSTSAQRVAEALRLITARLPKMEGSTNG